jgi:hypothetical protein
VFIVKSDRTARAYSASCEPPDTLSPVMPPMLAHARANAGYALSSLGEILHGKSCTMACDCRVRTAVSEVSLRSQERPKAPAEPLRGTRLPDGLGPARCRQIAWLSMRSISRFRSARSSSSSPKAFKPLKVRSACSSLPFVPPASTSEQPVKVLASREVS